MKYVIPYTTLLSAALLASPALAAADQHPGATAPGTPAVTADAPQDPTTGEFDQAPKPLTTVAPVYPKSARKRGQEGTVYLRARVTTAGKTEQVTVSKGVAPDLDEAAVKALRRWTFEPARKDGKPVAAEIMVPVQFKLDPKK